MHNLLLSLVAITCLFGIVLAQTPARQYSFANGNVDSCDGSVIGTPGTTTTTADECNNPDQALQFGPPQQITGIVRYPNNFFPSGSTDFTIAFRYYMAPSGRAQTIVSVETASIPNKLVIVLSIGGGFVIVAGGGGVHTGVDGSAGWGTWGHFALTVTGTSANLFLNGTLHASFSWPSVTYEPTDFTVLGNDQDSVDGDYDPKQAFVGKLDDLRLYTSGLSAPDIQAISTESCAPCPVVAPSVCSCSTALDVDYTSDRIPDAAKDAYATIVLNERTWEVEFTVNNALHLNNGHVIANKVNTAESAQVAFTPYIQSWDGNELWKPSNCSIGSIDMPASSMGIAVTRYDNCTKSYQMIFSLVNGSRQSAHCQLTSSAQDLSVGCSLVLSSVRAYDLTEPSAFLSAETSFVANITLPRNLNKNVTDLLYATLAKCNVLNIPSFAVDCRIPGLWTFESTFIVAQNIPDWIDSTSCAQSTAGDATFVRCSLASGVSVASYTEAIANLTATIGGGPRAGETLTFSLEYTLPRLSSATASASLQNFIISIGMLNEKYYYAGADRATIQIEAFDTSRLQIMQLDMFNANGQTYSLRDYNQFQLSESNNATHFLIEFRPSAIRQDSAFYRNGPHGVNISFLFTAAGTQRRMALSQTDAEGFVTVENINVKGPADASPSSERTGSDRGLPAASSSALATIAILVGGILIAAVAVLAVVLRFTKRNASPAVKGSAPTAPHVDEMDV